MLAKTCWTCLIRAGAAGSELLKLSASSSLWSQSCTWTETWKKVCFVVHFFLNVPVEVNILYDLYDCSAIYGTSYESQSFKVKLKEIEFYWLSPLPYSTLLRLKDSLRQGHVLLYRPILYIQQWIYTLNEMEGREMLKSPSREVLSTGAWYKKTPNDNLHTLATARLSGRMSVRCQVWEEYKKDIGSKSTSVSRFLLNT